MYVKVKVTPGAKKETFVQSMSDTFVISVREKAKQNAANRRVVALVATHFSVAPRAVRLVNGHRSGSKILRVETPSPQHGAKGVQ